MFESFLTNKDFIPQQSVKLLNHIINAHQIWNNRIQPKQRPFGVWQMNDFNELGKLDQFNYEQSLEILEQLDMDKVINYQNTKGLSFEKNVETILFHVINHGTYHRAQIATDYRIHNLEPIPTDYIFFQ